MSLVDFGVCLLLVGTRCFSDISVYSNGEFLDDMDKFGAAMSLSYKKAFADFPQGVYRSILCGLTTWLFFACFGFRIFVFSITPENYFGFPLNPF